MHGVSCKSYKKFIRAENNLYDVEYDRGDPAKQHFPLVNGSISVNRAWTLDYLLLWVVMVLGIYLSLSKLSPISYLFLVASVFFGTLYNKYSKRTLLSPLFITAAFTSIPLFSFFAVSNTLSMRIMFIALYTVFLMIYQISVAGFLKDIGSDRVNLLRFLGTLYGGPKGFENIVVSRKTKIYAYSLMLAKVFTLIMIGEVVPPHILSSALLSGSVAIFIFLGILLLQSGRFVNAERVRIMSLSEIFTYFALIFALQGLLGWILTLFFVIFPITWFVLMNRLTFGTLVRPRV